MISENYDPGQRNQKNDIRILITTDVLAEGVNLHRSNIVINYDLPELGEDYVHRIGRTARAGKSGVAISFACEDYAMNLIDIETYTRRAIPTVSISNDLLIKPNPPVKMKEGRIKPSSKPGGGGRPSALRQSSG